MKNPTQKDIAHKLKLSVTAVSKALNNDSDISEARKQQVRECANEIGYVRNFMASNIRRSSSMMVGLVCSDLSQPYFSSVLFACENVLLGAGYQPLLFSSYEDAQRELNILNQLSSLNVAGMIVALAQNSTKSIQLLRRQNIPYVLFTRWHEKESDHYVVANDYMAGYIATRCLLEQLPSHPVLCINGPDNISPTRMRYEGYLAAMKEQDIAVAPGWVFNNLRMPEDGYRVGIEAGRRIKPPFTAFCSTDFIASGFLRGVFDQGLYVPQDVSIISVDDIIEARYMTPALSTVVLPKEQIGAMSAGMLLKLIACGSVEEPHLSLEPKLVLRETTRNG